MGSMVKTKTITLFRCSGVSLLLALASCGEDPVVIVDNESIGVIAGSVLGLDASPRPGVRVEAINARHNCAEREYPGPWGFDLTGAQGDFEVQIHMSLLPPGRYCVDLQAAEDGNVNLVTALEIMMFESGGAPPDTLRQTVLVNWD
jgi:hypothetical protein